MTSPYFGIPGVGTYSRVDDPDRLLRQDSRTKRKKGVKFALRLMSENQECPRRM